MSTSKLITPGKWYVEYNESGERIAYVYEDSACKLLGFDSREEYIEALGSWDSAIHPDDEERVNQSIAEVEAKHPEGLDYDIEYRIMTKWGYHWIHDYGHAVRREDGSLIRVDGVTFDIQDIIEKENISKQTEIQKEKLKTQQMQLEESLAFTNFFVDQFVSAYYIGLDDGSCKVYKRTGELDKNYPIEDDYYSSLKAYINEAVHPEDRAELLEIGKPESIRRLLRETPVFYHIYRDISGGIEKRYRFQIIRGADEAHAAMGFEDLTEEFRDQEQRLLGAVPLSPDVLTKANIGLWSFELDEGSAPRMYADEAMLGLIGLDHQIAPEDTYHAWYDNIDPAHYDEVANAVEKMVSGEHAEVQYPWHNPNGETWIVRCGGVRNYAYTKGIRIEGTHQNVTHLAHIQKKNLGDMLSTLSDDFLDVYFLDPYTGSFESYANASSFDGEDDRDFSKVNFYEDVADKSGGIVHPEDKPLIDKMYSKENLISVVESGETQEFVVRWPTGQGDDCIYMQNKLTSFIDGDGSRKLIIGVRDVTQEKKTQKALEAANNAKTEFLFNMSHDIRTPMNAILGYTDIAMNHIDEPDRVGDSLKKIRLSGGHLLKLINDILEMSRIEAGKMEIVSAPMNSYEVMEGVVTMSRSLAATKDITFNAKADSLKNPYIYADELHVNQIVINLISNAIKYTNPGGTVDYILEQIGDPVDSIARYRVTVKDNGIGMSEEFQKHLFESFSREQSATVSKQEGAGLGLAIVKKIVDMMNGSIAVHSKLGEGSTFVFELPLKVMDEKAIEEFEASRKKEAIVTDELSFDGQRVLLVEDNEMNREIATEILEEVGLVIDTAEDGAIAVRKVIEKGASYYDFILMDIQMPVMDGYEATDEIRKLPDADKIPIIALSANAFKEDMDRSLAAGMNAHVAKPINVKTLLETMRGLTK
ncbi:MAG: ATP-binding protein [Eubacteriales bacterium]|nr:ATP-binding protein [Eubacteriales bacterium]